MLRPRIALLLTAFVLVSGACAKTTPTGDGGETTTPPTQGPPAPTASSGKPTVTVPNKPPPKNLVVEDLRTGSGPAAKAGDNLVVHYVGVSYSTGVEFDSSWNSGTPFPITLGAGQVIQGWDQGLVGMREGGRRELIIPPDLGYGAQGYPPVIAPNETLIFVIDLIQLQPA